MRPKSKMPIAAESLKFIDDGSMALLKNRDAVFLETLFREVNPYLNRVCLANGIGNDDVNELIHRTWEQFFSHLEKFQGRSQIRTFICGILFNKAYFTLTVPKPGTSPVP